VNFGRAWQLATHCHCQSCPSNNIIEAMGCERDTRKAYSPPSEGGRPDRLPRVVQPRAQIDPNPVSEPLSPSCLIIKLPLELFAEILLYTASPRDVLSVARCCKFFCATLLNPSSSYIWKGVRTTYPVPLPDPISTFTEASYAAFMFDAEPCEVRCSTSPSMMCISFGHSVLQESDGHVLSIFCNPIEVVSKCA